MLWGKPVIQVNMSKKKTPIIIFLFYLVALLYVLLFAERNVDGLNGYNTQLFAEIQRYIQYREILGMKLVARNLLGNVAGFLPFGFLLPWINRSYDKLWKTTLAAGAFSLTIEIIQLISGVGCFDVDDVFLNGLGGLLGHIIWNCFQGIRMKYENEKRKKKV